jgi:hypothetical protein
MIQGFRRLRARFVLMAGLASVAVLGFASSAGAATFNSPTGAAAPGSSALFVSGLTGTITDVEVTMPVSHQGDGRELDIAMKAPGGQQSVLMSDACQAPMFGIVLTFSEAGAEPVSSGACAGQNGQKVKPANYFEVNQDFPNVPASMATYNGADPNGAWTVEAFDDTLNALSGGFGAWTLAIGTTTTPIESATPTTGPATQKKCKKKKGKRSAASAKKKKCKKKKRK